MKPTASAVVLTVIGFSMYCAPVGQAAQNTKPTIISFDAPGADTTAGNYNGTFPSGVNGRGDIVGAYIDVNDVYHGFLRSPSGKFRTFQAPGADTTTGDYNGTFPNAVNDLGTITGYYIDAKQIAHGFLLCEGKFTSFDVPGSSSSFPIGINLEGAVVGYYTDTNDVFHAFLRRAGGAITTYSGPDACDADGAAGCYGSGATSINVFGEIAGGFADSGGNFVHHGLIRSVEGKLTPFEAPGAGTGSYQGTGCPGCAPGLNLWGAIAGIFTDTGNVYHGYLRSPQGKFTTFNVPGAGTAEYQGTGCPSDCNVGLNDFGAIAGNYLDANFTYRVFLRNPEGEYTLIDPPGSQLTSFNGLNDESTVTGYYLDANDVYHGFLSIP